MDNRKPWAIFVLVREEYFFLPKWYQYYSRYLNDQDIYIIHHVPDPNNNLDTCTDFLKDKCNIIEENHDTVDGDWILKIIKKYQTLLLKEYQAVIYTDVDEIIFIDTTIQQSFNNLAELMMQFIKSDLKFLTTKTFSLMHQPNIEQDFIDQKNIMDQRSYWYRDHYYDKVLISKIVNNHARGMHLPYNHQVSLGVLMLHLHQYDFDAYINRHVYWATKYKFADFDLKNNRNYHYRRIGEKLTHQFLHHYSVGVAHQRIRATLVPDFAKMQINI